MNLISNMFIALALGLGANLPNYASDLIDASDPEAILAIAQNYGDATLSTDDYDDPHIEGEIDGVDYEILFDGCEDGKNCEFIILTAWTSADPSALKVNAWNADSNFGRVFIDSDGDVVVDIAINLAYGVSKDNLNDTFEWWEIVLEEFAEDFID